MKIELFDHPKFKKLARLLGEPRPHVVGYLECMWRQGYQLGTAVLGDADGVEAAAEYTGERGKFATAAFEAGFVDRDADGSFLIHDLYDHAPKFARLRMQRKGTAPARSCPDPAETVTEGHVCATDETREGTKGHGCAPKKRDKREESKEKDIAATPPAVDDPPAERARDELWDALVEVTGADTSIRSVASHVGRVKKALSQAKPAYSPDEVRALPGIAATQLPWSAGRTLTLGEIEKNIGLVRSHGKPVQVVARGPRAGPAAAQTEYAKRTLIHALED